MIAKHPPVAFIKALRQDSRDWWYHRQLREQGRTDEARKLEHRTVKSNVHSIRAARKHNGVFSQGPFGTLFRFEPNTRSSGLHPHFREAIAMAGVTVIDTREMPNNQLVGYALSTPILSLEIEQDELPMTSFTYVTPSTYIAIARAWGAKIINDTGAELPAHVSQNVLPKPR